MVRRVQLIALFIAIALLLPACGRDQPPVSLPPEETITNPSPDEDALTEVDPSDYLDSVVASQLSEDVPAEGELNNVIEPAVTTLEADENGFVWRVAPTLEYGNIFYCQICNIFFTKNHDGLIDPITGQPLELPFEGGHGGEADYLFYDRKNGLFVYYSDGHSGDYMFIGPENDFKDFLETISWLPNSLYAFQSIDSDKIKELEIDDIDYDPLSTYDFSNANISEKYGLAYGTVFVSDFIYDTGISYNINYFLTHVNTVIAVRLDEKWGIIDKDGNTAVPFLFEDILLIDEETAFAKFGGKYGILDIERTINN